MLGGELEREGVLRHEVDLGWVGLCVQRVDSHREQTTIHNNMRSVGPYVYFIPAATGYGIIGIYYYKRNNE